MGRVSWLERHKARPVLPILALVFSIGILLGRSATVPQYALFALLPTALLYLRRESRMAAVLLTCLLVGWAAGYGAFHPSLPQTGTARIHAIICDEVTDGSSGNKRTRLSHISIDGQPIRGDAYWSFYPSSEDETVDQLIPGRQIEMTATVYAPSGADNPGGYDFREALLGQGMRFGVSGLSDAQVSAPAAFSLRGACAGFRHRLSVLLVNCLGEEAGSYAAGLLLGVRTSIPEEDRDAFSRLGIAHLLSVSGFHVGVLLAILGAVSCLLPKCFRFPLMAVCLAFYVLLTGAAPSVVRASILALFGLLFDLLHRSRSQQRTWNALALAWIVMLLINPAQLLHAGFQMSFAAMIGITVLMPTLQKWASRYRIGKSAIVQSVLLSFAAQLGVLLPQLYHFHAFSWTGILLSPLALAAGSLLIVADWVILLLLPFPAVADFVGRGVAAVTSVLTQAIRWSANLGHTLVWTGQANLLTALGWVLLIAALSALWRNRTRLRKWAAVSGLCLMILSLIPLPFSGTEYLQLSVGNADSAILRDGNTVTVIDTGEDGFALSTYLHQRRLRIDTLILTHLHMDHAGGVAALLNEDIPIGRVVLPVGAETAAIDPAAAALMQSLRERGIPVETVAAGDRIALPNGSLTVLWPEREKVRAGLDANLYSLTMLAELRGATMLLTGDLDGTLERYAAMPADLLKVAHHGSKSSTGEEFLSIVSPQAAILSCKTLQRQADTANRLGNVPLFGTARSGAIRVTFDDGGRIHIRGFTYHATNEEGEP